MTAFADTSAIVKLYATEDGSDRVRAEPGSLVVSAMTKVETASALWRKSRDGDLDVDLARLLVAEMNAAFARHSFHHGAELLELPVADHIIGRATNLCAVHSLRAGDAIQLATALTARHLEPSCSRFLVFDRRLADAAAREGFAVVGPALG